MEKRAIYSIMTGDSPIYPYVMRVFKAYAQQVGAEFICCREPKHSKPFLDRKTAAIVPCIEKFEIPELLKSYDRVLYLDADVLIMPGAANIFKAYPNPTFIYAFNEGFYKSRKKEAEEIFSALGERISWPTENNNLKYYNAGVMLFSKQHIPFFEKMSLQELEKLFDVSLFEQTYFNYIFFKHQIPVHNLDFRFNRMDMKGGHFFRFRTHFLHYAGAGFTGKYNRRNALMIDDYWTFLASQFGEEAPEEKQVYYAIRRFLYHVYWPITIPAFNYF